MIRQPGADSASAGAARFNQRNAATRNRKARLVGGKKDESGEARWLVRKGRIVPRDELGPATGGVELLRGRR